MHTNLFYAFIEEKSVDQLIFRATQEICAKIGCASTEALWRGEFAHVSGEFLLQNSIRKVSLCYDMMKMSWQKGYFGKKS